MDFTTILGILGVAAFILIGTVTNNITSSLLNMHAVVVVFGGTLIALLINTPFKYLLSAFTGLKIVFFNKAESAPEKIIPIMVDLAQECRTKGLSALKEADS